MNERGRQRYGKMLVVAHIDAQQGPERRLLALEELGATFIKLGQILSTRADLLPSSYQIELAKLQDQAAPLPRDVIEAVVQAELGRPLRDVFASFGRIGLIDYGLVGAITGETREQLIDLRSRRRTRLRCPILT